MRIPQLAALLLALAITGCSNSSSVGVGASAGTGYYGNYYGSYPWWYDDYFGYWGGYYPWCCDDEGDFDEIIKKWWAGLDEDRQQEIKDNLQEWLDNEGKPDIAALRSRFAARWNTMSPEQKAALRENRQQRPSVSNPDRAPRSPLDDKAASMPRINDGMRTPSALPKVDNGALPPSPRRENGAQVSPHLPRSLASPGFRAPQRAMAPIRPAGRPSGGGGFRRR